jgi:LPXTG-motif cell wall-anchored protein
MIEMILRRIFISLLILLLTGVAIAQKGVTVKASVDKNKILIGEPMQLTVEASFPLNTKTSFFNIDSIAHFEISGVPVIDSSSTGNRTIIKGIYQLTSFDSGHWVIPSFLLYKKIKTDTIPVDIVFSDFNPNQDYHDIKDIIEVEKQEKKNWLWYAVAGGVLLLLLLYFLLRKKKQPAHVVAAAPVNAYEEAMKQLDLLKRENLSSKQYHTKLVDIFRLYVYRKKNIQTLQKTTDALVMQLRGLIADTENYNQLQQALRLSDFVKFAKYESTKEDNTNTFNTIKKSIQLIEQLT